MTKHDAFRREHILDAIERFQRDYGHSPSVRDIKEAVGLASTSAVFYHLMAMERDGLIVRCSCGCQRPVLA